MMANVEKPAHISQEAWDSVDVPELTDEQLDRVQPLRTLQPDLYEAWKRSPGGRPTIHDRPKVHVGFRLAADVVEGIKATGRGYNARVEKVLRAALAKGQL